MKSIDDKAISVQSWRVALVFLFAFLIIVVLLWRIIDLQVQHSEILQSKADARQQRVVDINASRGAVYDRNGHVLAVSTPVDSVWVNPKLISDSPESILALANFLEIDFSKLNERIQKNAHKTFLYVKRHMPQEQVAVLMEMDLQGVFKEREYKRYYPMGEVTSHLLGFTNIDDKGQEGVELAYEHWLKGDLGKKRVLRNRLGQVIEELEYIQADKPGKDLNLSIDKRIQYIAYRELKKAVSQHKAKSGSVAVIDITTGEVMALANQPSFNPNNRSELQPDAIRNRAIIDVFEPGSTMKTFTIAAALESGKFTPNSRINTAPGKLSIGEYTIKDTRNYGVLDVPTILVKSSNIGASKLALDLPSEDFWSFLNRMGFGKATNIGYPGEQSGVLHPYNRWSEAGKAALSYGYGVATTTLQLAHAYASIANDGVRLPLTMQKRSAVTEGDRVLSSKVAVQVKDMLKHVVSLEGTAIKAAIPGYQVGGKTGTVKVSQGGGYAEDKYIALFAGIVPIKNPKYAVVVVINEPSEGEFYGGHVAAPVFANIMSDTLRFMNIIPDDLATLPKANIDVAAKAEAKEANNG